LTNQLLSTFRIDVRQFTAPGAPPRGIRLLTKVLLEPGLQFALLARIQMALEARKLRLAARLVHLFSLRTTGAEFGHGCEIGAGLVAKHPLGMVIGGGTKIGKNCTILHNVTFGERRPDEVASGQKYPVLGDDCLIGTAAIILGAVTIGDRVRVGAGSVVLGHIPSDSTVVGIPAKRIESA
jgi:serine O-acetyltransferase